MGWRLLLVGLLLWALHFFSAYAIASIWHSSLTARVLTMVATVLCLAAAAWFIRRLLNPSGDGIDQWMRKMSLILLFLASIAIIWQSLPAFLA
jgi:hypothetical protein